MRVRTIILSVIAFGVVLVVLAFLAPVSTILFAITWIMRSGRIPS